MSSCSSCGSCDGSCGKEGCLPNEEFDLQKQIGESAHLAFSACKKLGATQVNLVVRDDAGKPFGALFCTLDPELAEKLEKVVNEWEKKDDDESNHKEG